MTLCHPVCVKWCESCWVPLLLPLPPPGYRQKVEQEEVDLVFEACDMLETLNDAKLYMLKYVESRMSLIAPNLSAMVGSTVATKLMGGSHSSRPNLCCLSPTSLV